MAENRIGNARPSGQISNELLFRNVGMQQAQIWTLQAELAAAMAEIARLEAEQEMPAPSNGQHA